MTVPADYPSKSHIMEVLTVVSFSLFLLANCLTHVVSVARVDFQLKEVLSTSGNLISAAADPLYTEIIYLQGSTAVCSFNLTSPTQFKYVAGSASSATNLGCTPLVTDSIAWNSNIESILMIEPYYRPAIHGSSTIRKLLLGESRKIFELDLITGSCDLIIGSNAQNHQMGSFPQTRITGLRSMVMVGNILYFSSIYNKQNGDVVSECNMDTKVCIDSTVYPLVSDAILLEPFKAAGADSLIIHRADSAGCAFEGALKSLQAPCNIHGLAQEGDDLLYSTSNSLFYFLDTLAVPCMAVNSTCYLVDSHDLLTSLGEDLYGMVVYSSNKLIIFKKVALSRPGSRTTVGHFTIRVTKETTCGPTSDKDIYSYSDETMCILSCVKSVSCKSVLFVPGLCQHYGGYQPSPAAGKTCYVIQ